MKTRLIRVIQLSVPAIMAQISSIIMQYIDAGMVGSLGADATASIGLVSSTTWLINGIGMACAAGFAVQVAQYVGAGNDEKARSTMRQSLLLCTQQERLAHRAAGFFVVSGPDILSDLYGESGCAGHADPVDQPCGARYEPDRCGRVRPERADHSGIDILHDDRRDLGHDCRNA